MSKINITKEAKTFLKLFYDSSQCTEKVLPNLSKITLSNLEMIFFSYKIFMNCLNSENSNYYKELISDKILNTINNNFIPGGESNENNWVNSVIEMEKFLLKENDQYKGAYICSCGQWYIIERCGLPKEESKCSNCNEIIGGTEYVPFDREGHLRIFKNKEQMDFIVKWINDNQWLVNHSDGKQHIFRCKTIEELKNEVYEKYKEEYKGYKAVSQKFFSLSDKKIRNLNQISYRILSLLYYSSLYFGKMLGYIDDNKIKQLIPEGFKNSFEVMIASYKLLENALKEKEIDEIQIFLNMIYPKLSNTLKLCPLTNTKEFRENVENKINEIIESSIQGYKDYKTNYINYNNEINKINIKSLRIIIQESIDPSLYPENDFPFFRFFMVPKYANKKQLIEELNLIPQSEQKYPIITNYLKDNGEIEVIQNLIKINPFVNSMIE